MTEKKHPINLDDDIYILLKEEQGRRKDKIALRQLLQGYVVEGIQRERELSNFDRILSTHFENSDDPKGFKEYLNQSYAGALIRLIDETQPSYQDIAVMEATIVHFKIKSKEFFKTIMVYARYGLSDLRGGE